MPSFSSLGIERRTPTPVSVRQPVPQHASQPHGVPEEVLQQADLMLAELAAAPSPMASKLSQTHVRLAVMGGGIVAMVAMSLGLMWLLGAVLT